MFRLAGQYVPRKSFLLAGTEALLIIASFWIAAWLRLGDIRALSSDSVESYQLPVKLATVIFICMLCFYYNDLYDLRAVSRRTELLIRLMQSLGVASMILAFLYYAIPGLMVGRGVSVIAAVITGVTLISWRLFVDATGNFFRPEQRLLIAGTGSAGIRLVREILEHPELNFRVMGFLDEKGENIGKRLVNPGIIGGFAELDTFVQRDRVDRVVLSFAERRGQMPVQKLLSVKFSGVLVEDAHSLYEKLTGRIMLERLTPSWLILSEGFSKSAVQVVLKRFLDVVLSATALLLLSPVALLVTLAIYLESGRPILFCQERVGMADRNFPMLKFRSMRQDSEANGPSWASKDDARITRVGRWIRRCRLDEIPQFLNVLRGDMSIVGPRPEQPAFVRMLSEQIPYYEQRHTVRPGITGWAQIKYRYGSSSEDAKNKLEYELFYIKHMSAFLDFLIMFRTVQVVLFGSGAV